MPEKKFFEQLNKEWENIGPLGSDEIQVYAQFDRYGGDPAGSLHSAVIITPERTQLVEHLRAVIYNPRTDNMLVIRDGDYEIFSEVYKGTDAEIALELTDKITILPPERAA